jgi:formylglycine-generating enzyme required for sulfatase activity
MKKAIIILAIVTLVSIIYATTMTVHTSSGDVDFEISEITSITFEDGGGEFEWCTVPAGDYTYGDPPVVQNISYDFQIMKYEVTNQQYVDYLEEALNAGDITVTTSTVEGYYMGDQNYSAGTYDFLDLDDNDCRIDWDGSNFSIVSGYEDHPVVEVTWFGSWAFAEHYGFSLPTEEEWEKAARGNTGYDYPWGNSIDGSRANYSNSGDPFEGNDVETTPVGMYNGQIIQGFSTTDSPSSYGAYDLAGNIWEWTDSWLSDSSSYRVRRGGGWSSGINNLRSWYRGSYIPTSGDGTVGFRCVVQ